jgi:hypothetical protein
VNPVKKNALNLITINGIAPHPLPLPSGEMEGVRGPQVKKIDALILIFNHMIKLD